MVQWRSDNFEWKKIRFSLKTQRNYVVSKYAHNAVTLFQKTHTTHDALSFAVSPLGPLATPHGFACNCRALLSLRCCTPLLPPLLLYIKKKCRPTRMQGGSWKLGHIFYVGRANLTRILRAYAGRTDPLCQSLHCLNYLLLIIIISFDI